MPSPETKLTLLVLANSADEEGVSYPNQAKLLEQTSMTPTALQTHLLALEELGLVVRTEQVLPGGSSMSDVFKLNIGDVVTNQKPVRSPENIFPLENSSSATDIFAPDPFLVTRQKKKIMREKEELFLLPDFIKPEVWGGYMGMRQMIRKPLAPHAIKLILKKLEKMNEEGEDVNERLEASIINNWAGVFPA